MNIPGSEYGLTPRNLLDMYRTMLRIRLFQEKAIELFTAGELPGFLHSYLGQEASATGVCAALRPDDYITSTHRGHGHVIAKGLDLNRMMAELFAKATGYCKGKGGSMHIADFSLGILGANGIVGAGTGIATGAALSCKMRNLDRVAVCFFGDGASNQGIFYESANLAAVWELPVVYVCENNLYAVSTHHSRHQKTPDIARRAEAIGIPGMSVYGNDPIAVYGAMKTAVERARSGGGPTLLETKTYKWKGHYIGDPATYRPKEEVQAWLDQDPRPMFEKRLVQASIASEAELKRIRESVMEMVEDAVAFARTSPSPAPEDALEDVFA